jgi:L-rhamnose mutarotase
MERLCFIMHLRAGTEDEYDRRHHELWPEMRDALVASGFHNYSLFRNRSTVIGYAECEPDAETALSVMSATSVDARWQESFAGFFVRGSDYTGEMNRFPQAWHLDES